MGDTCLVANENARGLNKHLKRLNAARHRMLDKLGGAFAPKASSGPHKARECLPWIHILRNKLKYTLKYRGVIAILMQRHVMQSSSIIHTRADKTYPSGFMDVVSIPKTNENFHPLYDTKGRFRPHIRKDEEAKLYIAYMGDKQHDDPDCVTAVHLETLSYVLGSKGAALDSIVYNYKHGFSEFAAMLSDSQAKQIKGLPGVLSVTLSRPVWACATRSWDFLCLSFNNPPFKLLYKASSDEDIIVGVVDSGVWPESKSFNDEGYGPILSRWKGTCQTGEMFNASHCNRKLIGARWYPMTIPKDVLNCEYLSPRDASGHGTHVASIAIGSLVQGANFHGLGDGLARGGAPRARLAVYKALWGVGQGYPVGEDASLAKAVEDAINDGVDVLSLSLSGPLGSSTSRRLSWATLRAVQNGITVVQAAGNNGPASESVSSTSPWVITVAASTIDRTFPTTITLGDNRTIVGQATYFKTKKGDDGFKELLYYKGTSFDSLNTSDIRGKIVICNMGDIPNKQLMIAICNVLNAGGVGLIFVRYTTNFLPSVPDFPYVIIDLEATQLIYEYIIRSSKPMSKFSITKTVLSDSFTPRVAAFSSRGPSAVFPAVLKPDIAAPGVKILAEVKESYVFKDGTSMATPHVTGVVVLLKSLHPSWSPAAIKSAIVTTASTVDKYGLPILAEGLPRKVADPFDYEGGNINPERVADPGLIYDIDPIDYEEFKCLWDEREYYVTSLRPMYHLNLPSISIPNLKTSVIVSRTVTNVADSKSTYKSIVECPPGISMEVKPSILKFDVDIKVQTFTIKFTNIHRTQGVYVFGSLTWADGIHRVRIPIAIRTVIQEAYADVQ